MEILNEFKQYLICERRSSKSTIFNHCYYIKRFLTFLSKSPIEVEPKDIQDYLACLNGDGLSNGTVSNFITSLRVFYNWFAYKNKTVALNDVCYFLNKIVRTRQDKSLPKVPSSSEVERLQEAIHAYKHAASFNKNLREYGMILRDVTLIELLITTGARSAEVRNIRTEDVNLEENTVLITKGKGNKQRISLFSKKAQELLKEHISYFNLKHTDLLFPIPHCNGLNALIRRWARKASINPQLHAHSFRHFHVTNAIDKGVPDRDVADQVGHVDLNMTRRYTHLNVNHRRERYKVCGIG